MKSAIKWGVISVFVIILGFTVLTILTPMEEVPSEEFVRKWDDIQPFMIEPDKITGIYRNLDIDAVVFKYSTTARSDKFWPILMSNLHGSKWQLILLRHFA